MLEKCGKLTSVAESSMFRSDFIKRVDKVMAASVSASASTSAATTAATADAADAAAAAAAADAAAAAAAARTSFLLECMQSFLRTRFRK